MKTLVLTLSAFSLFLMGNAVYIINPEEVTMLEDVVGAYELESVKTLIKNTSRDIKLHFNKVAKNASLKEELNGLKSDYKKSNKAIQESLASFQKDFKNLQGEVQGAAFTIARSETTISRQISNAVFDATSKLLSKIGELWDSLGNTFRASNSILASDCSDLYKLGYNASGSYWLQKFGRRVLCDMETDGGGWLVIQRRANVEVQVDFNQNWSSYKLGFGDLDTEFWIGNDILHILTNQMVYEMLIELEDYEKGYFYASYSSFRVGNEESDYQLDIGNYTGNCSDAFEYHHGQKFTTKDRDNDAYEGGNCASYFAGGWWHDRCYDAHLNGIYPETPNRDNASYITWWLKDESEERVPLVLTNVIIKIRPSDWQQF